MSKIINIRKGQLCTINNTLYRAYPRTSKCQGCDLDEIDLCPNVGIRKIECSLNNIILKRVWKRQNTKKL